MDCVGEVRVFVPTTVLYVIGLLLLAFSDGLLPLVLSALIISVGQGCAFSSLQTIATRSVEDDRLGAAISAYYIFADCGQAIGPMTLGLMASVFDIRTMYVFAAIIVALTLLLPRFLKISR